MLGVTCTVHVFKVDLTSLFSCASIDWQHNTWLHDTESLFNWVFSTYYLHM